MRPTRGLLAVVAAALVALLAACATPGGSPGSDRSDAEIETITSEITPEDVAELGDVTLRVLADAGEEETMKQLVPEYEEMYPNVTVDVEFRSYDDIVRTGVNTLQSGNAPDVSQGAQGYALDGTLVGAGLVRPLDDLAEVYDWSGRFGDSTLSEFRWNEDGTQFGTGDIYGLSPVVSMVGVYYNKSKLASLGIDKPTSFEEFEAALQTASSAGEQPIVLGNANKGTGLHVFGVVQGQNTEPETTRDWISGEPDASFVNDANLATATTIQDWASSGYFGAGYDGVAEDDAVGRFASGDGVFLIGGTWQMPAISAGSEDIGFMAMPPGTSGKHVASGSMGMSWHISSSSDNQVAGAAWIALITSDEWAQKMADLGRVPVLTEGVTSDDPLFEEAVTGSSDILGDGGNTYSFDWASGTMMATMGGGLQELMAGRTTPDQFAQTVQDDWQSFQEKK